MKYIVMTSKHHDGFAMYNSEADDFNIVKKTPFKRDVIKELADACKKHGMKFGLYYSQELDWHEEHGGGYALKESDYRSCGDNEIPNESVGDELVEAPTTLNTTRGYKTFDNEWKDADKVREIKKHLNDRGINYLLNVGPDYLGRIPVMAQEILRKVK